MAWYKGYIRLEPQYEEISDADLYDALEDDYSAYALNDELDLADSEMETVCQLV
jgi:hypothetical protein